MAKLIRVIQEFDDGTITVTSYSPSGEAQPKETIAGGSVTLIQPAVVGSVPEPAEIAGEPTEEVSDATAGSDSDDPDQHGDQ